MTAAVLFVGESPPPGAPADFSPFDCTSSACLARLMLGLRDRATLLEHVRRDNIFANYTSPKDWDPEAARAYASGLVSPLGGEHVIVALGRKTAAAFGMPVAVPDARINWAPPLLTSWKYGGRGGRVTCIYAPHPSGVFTTLASPEVRADVRRALIPELVIGCPTLRPWHFRLDDPAILHAFAAAVSPLCPALGAAALLWAADKHKADTTRYLSTQMWNMQDDGSPMAGKTPFCPPWDEPLAETTRSLLRHDGGRLLAQRWDPARSSRARKGADSWLVALAEDHAALNPYPRDATRATLAQYAAAELS